MKLIKVYKRILLFLFGLVLIHPGFANITQVSTPTNTYGAGVTSITISRPADVQSGDVMILNVARQHASNTTPIAASGWTPIVESGLSGSTVFRGAVFFRIVTSSEPASYVVNPSGGTSTTHVHGAIVAFRGVANLNPIDVQSSFVSPSNSTNTVSFSPIITTVANTLILQIGMSVRTNGGTRSYSGWTTTDPGALPEIYDIAGTVRTSLGMASSIKSSIGTTGNGSFGLSGNCNKGGIMLALRPERAHFRSNVTSGDYNTVASWQRSLDGQNWTTASRLPGVNDLSVLIQTGHTINVNASASPINLTVNGVLNVSGTSVLTANGANVNGTVRVQNTASFTGTAINFQHGSTYDHARNGGAIPLAIWNATSTCQITGVTTTVPTATTFNQSFGNFTWQSAGQTADVNLAGNLTTINGNMLVANTGTAALLLVTTGGTHATNIAGNYTQTAGTVRFVGGGVTQVVNNTINVGGNFSLSGGTLDMHANTTNAGNTTLNVSGNVNFDGGTFTETGISTANFNFAGTLTPRTFSRTAGTIINTINFNVNSMATVDFGTSILGGSSGTFNLSTGATLITANLNTTGALTMSGTNGTIQVTGTRTYNSAANYVLNGAGVQRNGNGLTQAANLTLNNQGTILTNPLTVAGVLNLQNGIVSSTATNLLTISNTSTNAIIGASPTRYIAGVLNRNLAPNLTGNVNYLFPIGNSTAYFPFELVNPTTGSGDVFVAVELVTGSTNGTMGANVGLMSTTEYWRMTTTGNFTNARVNATRPITPGDFNALAGSVTQTGQYWSLNGVLDGNSINNSDLIGTNRFFVFAKKITPLPVISVSTSSISSFTYPEANGPSSITSFTVSGNWLVSNIIIQTSPSFEISALGGVNFTPVSVLNIPAFGGTVTNSNVFVRMKAGLSLGNVSPEILKISAVDADSLQVTVSGEVTTRPVIAINPTSLSGFTYAFPTGISAQQSFVVTGTNLASNVVLTPPSNFEISLTSGSGFVSTPISVSPVGGSLNRTIFVRMRGNLGVGVYTQNLTAGSTFAETRTLNLSGTVTSPPTILLNNSFLSTFIYTSGSGPSGEQSFVVSGSNLTSNVTLTAPTNFQISTTSGSGFGNTITLTPSGGTVNTTIFVRMIAGLATNTYGPVNLAVNSTGALTKNVALRGSVVGTATPTILVSTNTFSGFGYLVNHGPSSTQVLTVSGASLLADITITAPSNYEISLNPQSGFVTTPIVLTRVSQRVNPTNIFVRLRAGLPPADYNQTLTVVAGAVSNPVSIIGKVFASPLIDAAGGGNYCSGSTINLQSTGDDIMNRYWLGPNNFYSILQNPTISNATPVNSGIYTVTGNVVVGGNLIVNGDFELGDVGFSSAYGRPALPLTTSSLVPEGLYAVVDLPSQVHGNFSSTAVDRTPTPGTRQMVINGNTQLGAVVWSQTVPVIPHAYYEFNYWVQTVVNGNDPSPSRLQLYVNGVSAGPVYTANPTTGVWMQFIYNTNAGENSILNLELINQNTVAGGNDFALDDIVFQQILPASATVNIEVNNSLPLSVGLIYSPTTIYQNTPVQYSAVAVNGGANPVYVWRVNGVQMGTNSSTFIYTPLHGDVVSVQVTSSLPCTTNSPATTSETMTVLVLTNFWLGSINNDWGNENNWTAGFVPVTGDNVEFATMANFGAVAQRDLVLDRNRTIGSLLNQTTRRLVVPSGLGLIVNNIITTDGNPDRIWIKADSLNANGTLIFNNPESLPVRASVEMFSKASFDMSRPPGQRFNWQFFGIPLRSLNAMPTFSRSFVRRKVEWGTAIFNHWLPLTNDSVLQPFVGYEIAQESPRMYVFSGELVNRNFNSGILPVTAGAIYPGEHLLSNPYTAAIDVRQIVFGSGMESAVYLYNTGTFSEWEVASAGSGFSPGTYIVIPQSLAGIGLIPLQIPSMSSMLYKVSTPGAGAFVNFVYNDVVMRNEEKQRARRSDDNKPDNIMANIRIEVEGLNSFDRMWLFSADKFSRSFDNGYDGRKIISSTSGVQIYALEDAGRFQINAVDNLHNTQLIYIPGNETVLRLRFLNEHLRSRYNKIYLYDLFNNKVIDISENETVYQFTTRPGNNPVSRFRIITVDHLSNENDARIRTSQSAESLYVYNLDDTAAKLYVFDMSGKLVGTNDLHSYSMSAFRLSATGVYILRVVYPDETINVKVMKD